MTGTQEKELFENMPMAKAIARLAVPTVIGQIILVIYNMADTFFIGLTGDEAKLTALTICMPAFMFLSAIANLFGVGGASSISRAMGRRDFERAKQSAAASFWGCILMTGVYGAAAFEFVDKLTDLLGGANASVHAYSVQYIKITVIFGGIATSMSMLLSHLIRSEGKGFLASIGIALGGVLNIILDPIFMFRIVKPGNEVVGAALATAVSNVISLLFFAFVLLKRRQHSTLSFAPGLLKGNREALQDIISAGFPAFSMTLCENLSYAVLDKLLAGYGVMVQAGIGVAKKINMLAHSIVRGMAQGVLPLIAYNYASGDCKRMRKASEISTGISAVCAFLCMAASLAFSYQLIGIFLRSGSEAVDYGVKFLRILCLGGPFSACAYTSISLFQATGMGKKALLLALMRKGILDIPLMFILREIYPVFGVTWATPIADMLCCVTAILMTRGFMKREHRHSLRKIAIQG